MLTMSNLGQGFCCFFYCTLTLIKVQVEVTDYSIDFIAKMMLVSAVCLLALKKESN